MRGKAGAAVFIKCSLPLPLWVSDSFFSSAFIVYLLYTPQSPSQVMLRITYWTYFSLRSVHYTFTHYNFSSVSTLICMMLLINKQHSEWAWTSKPALSYKYIRSFLYFIYLLLFKKNCDSKLSCLPLYLKINNKSSSEFKNLSLLCFDYFINHFKINLC